MMRIQVYITFCFPLFSVLSHDSYISCILSEDDTEYYILEPASFDVLCNKHNVSNLILRYPF